MSNEGSDDHPILELVQRMSDKLDSTVAAIHKSVDEKLSSTVSRINQSVDDKLDSSIWTLRQSLENTKADAQRRQRAAEKGKGRATEEADTPDPEEGPSTSRKKTWAEITQEDVELGLLPDEEELAGLVGPKKPRLVETSEATKVLVKEAFTSTLSNAQRREIRGRAPCLDLAETRCPRLDPLFKASESRFMANAEAKQIDNDLQKVQALMLDVAAPLLELQGYLEQDTDDLPRDPSETVTDAIRLLGNAMAQTSRIRRKRVLKACNPSIQDLADEDRIFEGASPNLFGQGFEAKMKERAESVKLLTRSQQTRTQSGTNRFFRGGHHSHAHRGGGPPYRGGRDCPQGNYRNPFTQRGRGAPKRTQNSAK